MNFYKLFIKTEIYEPPVHIFNINLKKVDLYIKTLYDNNDRILFIFLYNLLSALVSSNLTVFTKYYEIIKDYTNRPKSSDMSLYYYITGLYEECLEIEAHRDS